MIPDRTGATRVGLQSLKYKNTHYLLKEQGEYKTEHGMITCWRVDLINILQMLGIIGILVTF